jgi:hypothetical protein
MAKRIVLKKDLLTEGPAHDNFTKQLDEVIIKLENDPEIVKLEGGRRKRKQMGGACSATTRQHVRIALLATIAGALYAGGAELAANTAGTIGSSAANAVVDTMKSLYGAQCTISASNSQIQNLLCTKYSEALDGINSLILQARTNAGLSSLIVFISGISVKSVFSGLWSTVSSVVSAAKSTASGTAAGFEFVVEQICAGLPPETTERSAQTVVPYPNVTTRGMERAQDANDGGRRRKTRKMKKTRRSTRRRFIRG